MNGILMAFEVAFIGATVGLCFPAYAAAAEGEWLSALAVLLMAFLMFCASVVARCLRGAGNG